MADLGDAGEVLRYVGGFGAFVFSPRHRGDALRRWHEAGRSARSLLVIEAGVAIGFGIGLPLLALILIAGTGN